MAITANKKFWTEFIEIYHNLPCLWNTKDENYNNRESRSLAWNKLVEKLQQVEPNANPDSVKRKINTFRSNFNREVRKIRQTEKEQPAEAYHPTLWYFEHLSFLVNQEKCNSNGVSTDSHYYEEITLMGLTTAKSEITENETMQTRTISQDEEATDNDNNSHNEKEQNYSMLNMESNNRGKVIETDRKPSVEYSTDCYPLQKDVISLIPATLPTPQTFSSPENHSNHFGREKSVEAQNPKAANSIRLKRSKLRFKSHDPYNKHLKNNLPSSIFTDEAAIYGQGWACGFRKLSPQQKLFAKKAIDEILILGQLKALKLKTVPININFLEEISDQG